MRRAQAAGLAEGRQSAGLPDCPADWLPGFQACGLLPSVTPNLRSPFAIARAILFGVTTAIPIDRAGRIVLPSEAHCRLDLQPGSNLLLSGLAQRIELTPARRAGAALTLAPSRRKVLPPTGQPFDAAAATRDERSTYSHRCPDR